jgi:hypothetical protein
MAARLFFNGLNQLETFDLTFYQGCFAGRVAFCREAMNSIR